MSCVINYNNKSYSLEDFKNVLLQEPSLLKEVTNKSQEKLKAIQEIFSQNPELRKIGDVFSYAIYLDTIFPDSKVEEMDDNLYNSVLNQLEQENKIDKDCNGVGKLKAEKGLATSFVKGGKWKVIKDLKGYPTHKEGGVDLTIGKNGVIIKNGNTQFTAKYGLVIPKN